MRDGAKKLLAAEDMHDYAIYALDAAGNVASWNPAAQRLCGYTSGEVVGKHFSLFYLPEQADSGYPSWELERAAEDGFFIDRGWRLRKDGNRFWVHVVITAQRSLTGELDGFIKVVRNESAAEARRERTQRRFSDLFELTPSAIALLDDDGRFLDANGALCSLLGHPLPELRKRTGEDVLHPADPGGALLASTPLSPIPHRILQRSDGEPVRCQVYSSASVGDDGSRSWLVIFHDVTAQIRHAELLRHQATHDDLTGLLNRRGFEERLEELLPPEKDGQVGVVFCDLNKFKRVNDALGHEAGDQLLRAVARRLRELPGNCEPARFYGDEFAIICTDLDGHEELAELTRRVAALFRMNVPLRERTVRVSAAVGATAADVDNTSSDLLRSAESAMHEDRIKGCGQIGVSQRPQNPDRDQLALEERLREDIAGDRLTLHYQPVVANDGTVSIAEALLRWEHPELGTVPPNVVLDVAAEGGMLADLDVCVLRTALREALTWPASGGNPVKVSVNLAGLRPELPDFADIVRGAIEEIGIPAERVVLEMVETVLAQLGPEPREAMTELVEEGVQFAVDDFGTGYSSLARIKEMPTQIIKLDRMFVSGVGSDSDDLGITRAVTELARTLGRYCIAEGIETNPQHHLLRAVGVDAYQGYLFTRPLPAEDFHGYLAEAERTASERRGPVKRTG
ncbi:EAL domain-containing protein [Saccharopolyspora griseoalba]|uniref:EAL domain-containing protein n=1 Tax=Saccharopolyspora griseoalba TaxID=1431848 RepID=A0ABW2LFM0_9PSEU